MSSAGGSAHPPPTSTVRSRNLSAARPLLVSDRGAGLFTRKEIQRVPCAPVVLLEGFRIQDDKPYVS